MISTMIQQGEVRHYRAGDRIPWWVAVFYPQPTLASLRYWASSRRWWPRATFGQEVSVSIDVNAGRVTVHGTDSLRPLVTAHGPGPLVFRGGTTGKTATGVQAVTVWWGADHDYAGYARVEPSYNLMDTSVGWADIKPVTTFRAPK